MILFLRGFLGHLIQQLSVASILFPQLSIKEKHTVMVKQWAQIALFITLEINKLETLLISFTANK